MSTFPFARLPAELKFAVVNVLDDVCPLSQTDATTYAFCLPSLFNNVRINSYERLETFLGLPSTHQEHIRHLTVSTKSTACPLEPKLQTRTDALSRLLSGCTRLEHLELTLSGSLAESIIPAFPGLPSLSKLTIINCEPENEMPISERLVVSIAASIKNLEDLRLDGISRSKLHSPRAFFPVVSGDEGIPPHDTLGTALSLPSLMRLPTLKRLTIHNTHLGDVLWSTAPSDARAHLEVLDLGSSFYESEETNTQHLESILINNGASLDSLSLASPVCDTVFSGAKSTPLLALRKLTITPFFPVEQLQDGLSGLSGSPIEEIAIEAFEESVSDVCEQLQAFLTDRETRDLFPALTKIGVEAIDSSVMTGEERSQRAYAEKRLSEQCRELSLKCHIPALAMPVVDTVGSVPINCGARESDSPITTIVAAAPIAPASIVSSGLSTFPGLPGAWSSCLPNFSLVTILG